MAGLLNAKTARNPADEAQPKGQAPVEGASSADLSNVTKEEQAQYDEFVTNGMSLMNDKKGIDKILQAIGGDGNPVEGLANAVAGIVMRVEDSAGQGGMGINSDVLMHGGTELLEQAADLAEQAGVHTFTDDEMETALYMALDVYREARQGEGKLPQDKLEEELQGIQSAEADGSLEAQFPGLTELSQRAPPEEAAQPPQSGLLG